MIKYFTLIVFLTIFKINFAQSPKQATFYIGTSIGKSYALGDFIRNDDEILSPEFSDDGLKIDLYGGFFLNEKITLVGALRFQSFDTEVTSLLPLFEDHTTETGVTTHTEDLRFYSLLTGIAYRIPLFKNFEIIPRFAIGPMIVNIPNTQISSNDSFTQRYSQEQSSGLGINMEFGIGLRRNLGKRFTLLPTFTLSTAYANINNVKTTIDEQTSFNDLNLNFNLFNLGLSLAYRFY